ncbi:MAG: histidine kinase [Beijerinckiaceae bacterium]
MPSLVRLLVILAVLAGAGYAAMLALVTFVELQPHEIVQPLPSARLNK